MAVRRKRSGKGSAPRYVRTAVRGFFIMFLLCASVRAACAAGAEELLADAVRKTVNSPKVISFFTGEGSGLGRLLFGTRKAFAVGTESEPADGDSAEHPEDYPSESPAPAESPAVGDGPAEKPEGTGMFDAERLDGSMIQIENCTDYDIDVDMLLNQKPSITVSKDEPSVLIIHTHGSEAYMPDGQDIYEESDPSRTEDKNYNVVRVGDELAKTLEGYGITVLHDRELYDYPSYTGSYTRSLESIEAYLEQYPSIVSVIDVHRDAIADENGDPVRSVAVADGKECSQVLIMAGSTAAGLYHPYWQENLKFALRLQYAMDAMYPSLSKPLCITSYRYNQHATMGSLLIEVGSNGNTLQESLEAARCFGRCAAEVYLSLTEA